MSVNSNLNRPLHFILGLLLLFLLIANNVVAFNHPEIAPCSSAVVNSTIYYVSITGDDTNDGQSWATSFLTLQQALSVTASGDQIWVAAGTYYPDEGIGVTDDDVSAAFAMQTGVQIYGGFAGNELASFNLSIRDFVAHETILSGDIDQDDLLDAQNSTNVFFNNNVDDTAILDGFTISGGNGIGGIAGGGGMTNRSATPTIRNCVFKDNQGSGIATLSSLTVIDCRFENNTASGIHSFFGPHLSISGSTFSGNTAAQGAGLYAFGPDQLTATNCTFEENAAATAGGGVFLVSAPTATFSNCHFLKNTTLEVSTTILPTGGAGLWSSGESAITVEGCLFAENASAEAGGGMYSSSFSSLLVLNSIFRENSATIGGAMYHSEFQTISDQPWGANIYNCVFDSNTASEGGAMYNFSSSVAVTNCTFFGNAAALGGALRNVNDPRQFDEAFSSFMILRNAILWGNQLSNPPAGESPLGKNIRDVDDANNDLSTTLVFNSLIEGTGGSGSSTWTGFLNGKDFGNNIDADPQFTDAVNGDFSLQNSSPAINAGDNGADLDYTSQNTTTIADIPTDIVGNTRITGTIDMGAYENNTIALPVELLHFKGECSNGAVTLQWATVSEQHNQGFYVEKSLDGKTWLTTGFVSGAGTTNERQQYQYQVDTPNGEPSYFRLQQVDFGGQVTYSEIIALTCRVDHISLEVVVFPNPVTSVLNYEINQTDEVLTVTLLDAQGRPVFEVLPQTRQLTMTNLIPGTYYLRITTTKGSFRQVVVKQ